jgi:hypothetical protein
MILVVKKRRRSSWRSSKPSTIYCPLDNSKVWSIVRKTSIINFSKVKIRTSSCNKAHRALLHDEVRILTFDDPTEEQTSKRPGSRTNTDFGFSFWSMRPVRPGFSFGLSVNGMFRSGTGCRANCGAFWRTGPGHRILLCPGPGSTNFNGPQSNCLRFCIWISDATITGLVTSIGIRSVSTAAY